MTTEMFTGYAIDKEDRAGTLALAVDPTRALDILCAGEIPDKVSSEWARVENQGRMNSCGGHADSSVGEAIARSITGSADTNWSRMYCYRTAQMEDGFRGDVGCTIGGLVRARKKRGYVPESMMEYPQSYQPQVDQSLYAVGETHVLVEAVQVNSTRQACEIIASGGGIVAGISWLESFAQERDRDITRAGGRSLGGHAIAFIGYEKRGADEWWPELFNSHGSQWAQAGRSFVRPDVFEWMIGNGTLMGYMGITGLKPDKQAPIDWNDPSQNPFLMP